MPTRIGSCVTICAALLLALAPARAQRVDELSDLRPVETRNMTDVRQAPVFIENRGQWDSQAKFLLRSHGLDMWVTDHGVRYDI